VVVERATGDGLVMTVMITELRDLPAGVIGFETTCKVRAEDYRDVIVPAVERAAALTAGCAS
jgi:hypothetical protein